MLGIKTPALNFEIGKPLKGCIKPIFSSWGKSGINFPKFREKNTQSPAPLVLMCFTPPDFSSQKINIHQKVGQDLTNGGPRKQVARLELLDTHVFSWGPFKNGSMGPTVGAFLDQQDVKTPPPQLRNQRLLNDCPAFTGDHSSSFSSPSTKS